MDDRFIKDDPLLLKFEFEPRMGFELFSLALEGKVLKNHFSLKSIFSSGNKREFFSDYLFSKDKRFLAISEYASNLKEGGNFDLILFDLQENKEAKISSVKSGTIEAKKFEGNPPNHKIIYHKNSGGFTREFEFNISDLNKWKSF